MVLNVKAEEKTKTVAKAAMIPNDLVMAIDVWVKDGYYSNRADFMYCAIRDYMDNNLERCFDIYRKVIEYEIPHEMRFVIYNENVREMREEYHREAMEFFHAKGERTQIMVKLPKLLNDQCTTYYGSFDDVKTFQNLAIVSVVLLLEYLTERFGFIDELGHFLEKPRRGSEDGHDGRYGGDRRGWKKEMKKMDRHLCRSFIDVG